MPAPPPLGGFFTVNGHRLHADFHPGPTGAPTVVFEAALGGSSLGWTAVERGLRGLASTVVYDRAGLGWSDAGPLPRDLPTQCGDLRALLAAAEVPPPYLLVGHSYGALIAHWLAARRELPVAGVVLVDPPALEVWTNPTGADRARLDNGIRLARRGVWAARCGLAQLAAGLVAAGALTPAANLARWVSGGRLRPTSDFNFAPVTRLPQDDKAILRWIWTRPRFYQALASQMQTLPDAARAVAAAPLPDTLPLVVLSAADTPPAQRAEHERLARQSRRGVHRAAHGSGHWIPLEEPELVLAAIREVLAAVPSAVHSPGPALP